MYPLIYRTLRSIWPGGQQLRSRQKELEQTQWLPHEKLEAYQLERLKKLIQYAYEFVPYYRERYTSLGIHPNDIQSFQDFQKLPFLTREEVNAHKNELVSRDPNTKVLSNSTGGSTGVPMQFFNEKSYGWWDPALELRGRGWYGVREGERVAFVWGAKRDLRIWNWRQRLRANILQERYLNAFDMTDQQMDAFAHMLVEWKPAMFRAYASALTLFAQYVRDHHIKGILPKLIETTAEKVTGPQREILEDVFGCKVADWYTARELGTIAYQCPQGSLHVAETRYLEIIANGLPAQTGELGEVVITSLHQYGMPFIRYKIGDMAIGESKPCSCGRGLFPLKEVVGRLQDFLVTNEGRFVHGGFFPHTFRLWPEIAKYQVYQPDREHIEIRLVCYSSVDSNWQARLHEEMQKCFGAKMNINIKIVDSIPLTAAGKHRFIISDVKPDFV